MGKVVSKHIGIVYEKVTSSTNSGSSIQNLGQYQHPEQGKQESIPRSNTNNTIDNYQQNKHGTCHNPTSINSGMKTVSTTTQQYAEITQMENEIDASEPTEKPKRPAPQPPATTAQVPTEDKSVQTDRNISYVKPLVTTAEQLQPGLGNTEGNSFKLTPADPEEVNITPDLKTRLHNAPRLTGIPFFLSGRSGIAAKSSTASVRLPFVLRFNSDNNSQLTSSWHIIVKQLQNIPKLYHENHTALQIMQKTISAYCSDANRKSNFSMLNRADIEPVLKLALPEIVDHALLLPSLIQEHIPILISGESKTLFLTRKLCCSLLANAFFCTFPTHTMNNIPDFNFFRLYNDTMSDRCEVKKEKLKCIINYFRQMHAKRTNSEFQDQIVSFERRCILVKTDWANIKIPLCNISVDNNNKIEQATNMLQVDFANKIVGGGVLNDGSVMEEIRFSTCPELIVSRLFTQTLDNNEVLVVTGTEKFSEYSGYSTTFKYEGPAEIDWGRKEVDNLGRTYTQLVTMDANYYRRDNPLQQFKKHHIDRELHKCKVAFHHGKACVSPVATGNWGCGAYSGNPELKFCIQWMAASKQDRPLMQYYTNGDKSQGQAILDMGNLAKKHTLTVSRLYEFVSKYESASTSGSGTTGLFNYIKVLLEV